MARVVLLAGLDPGNGRLPRVASAGRPWVDVDVQFLDVDDVLDGRRAWAANPDPHPPSPQPLLRGVEWRGQLRPQWPIPLDARLRGDAVNPLTTALLQLRPTRRGGRSWAVVCRPAAAGRVTGGSRHGELPAPVMSAQRGQALVAEERPGQADQDGRSAGAPLPAVDLSVVRGVGSSTVVSGSVGSYRPVIAGAKLREDATTILPRGRALQGVALSSMRFHPIGGETEDDKDGQKAWFTTRIASLIG